ncbi:MAG: DNA-binding transcriptional regulator [Verrucomicrobiae bacterium]|nr:DNA-binding transcriptional regulator [Verrucomicrobiae bacterium]
MALIYDARQLYDVKVMTGVAAYVREVDNWSVYIEENSLRDQRLPDLRTWRGDGIIADFDDPRVAAQVTAARIPSVGFGGGFGWYDPASRIPYIFANNRAIARLAAEHLLDRGFHNFAFCGYPANILNGWSRERGQAFAERVGESGFGCSTYVGRHRSTRDWEGFRASLTRWLAALPKPVGLMAADDKRARQVLEVCRLAGIQVPDEVAVIGVDNDEMLCQLSHPSLSSVESGARRVGHEAAALLDQLMSGKRPAKRRWIVDPEGVVTRQSTDVLAVDDAVVARAVAMIRNGATAGVTAQAVCDALALSRTTLELRFKRAMGRTLFAEIRRVQLERAERLIRESDLTLKQIAAQSGFGSVQHMTTLFAARFGSPPAAYRRQILSRRESKS